MSSHNRDRRSWSASPDRQSSKPKRTLDLVTTRNISPPTHHTWHPRGSRGRGRSSYRPYARRGSYGGATVYRGASQRYYPRRRQFDRRDDLQLHSRHRRSRSRGHSRSRSRGHSRERSGSRSHHRHSRSGSTGSRSGSRQKNNQSRSHERRHSDAKDVKLAHLRSSVSPDSKVPVKKKARRRSSPSPDRPPPPRKARSGSDEKRDSLPHSQTRPRSKHEDAGNYSKYLEDFPHRKADEKGRLQEDKFKERSRSPKDKYRERSRSPVVKRSKKTSAAETKGKERLLRNRLHGIFSLISQDADFELEEDISIAIQRNPYAEPSEDSTVTVVFDEELFAMIYPYEGRKHKPIFDREEIKVFGHDKNLADDPDFERRVIRLKPGKSSQADSSQSSSYHYQSSLEITRTVKRDRARSTLSRSRSRSLSPSKHREPKFRLRVSTDPRFEARYAELQRKEVTGRSSQHSNLDPTDLRHELSSSRKSSSDTRSHIDRDRDRHDDRRRPDNRDSREEQKKDKEELPDFSRRKDKYQYTPWLDQPELIPKDPKYFMHDDRDGHDPRDRGRGRFFRGRFNFNSRRPFRPYRSRGSFRGTYRGRGNYPNEPRPRSPRRTFSAPHREEHKSMEREWKHDKFSELEREGEKKLHREDDQHPHSTTER